MAMKLLDELRDPFIGRTALARAVMRQLDPEEFEANSKDFRKAVKRYEKRLARITRFLNACHLLREGDCEELAQVACHSGYYDQSHFTHDFRSLAGMTPGEFLVRPDVSFLDLD